MTTLHEVQAPVSGPAAAIAGKPTRYRWVILLMLGLMALIIYQLLILRRKLRDRVFGSKLTLRLMAVFTLIVLRRLTKAPLPDELLAALEAETAS